MGKIIWNFKRNFLEPDHFSNLNIDMKSIIGDIKIIILLKASKFI